MRYFYTTHTTILYSCTPKISQGVIVFLYTHDGKMLTFISFICSLNVTKIAGLILWDICTFSGWKKTVERKRRLQFHRGAESVSVVLVVYRYSYVSVVIIILKPILQFKRAWSILCMHCYRNYVFASVYLSKINK